MKVQYDRATDALYLELDDQPPDGVIEIDEGVNLDTTQDEKITGIEILNASKRVNIENLLTYTLDIDRSLLTNSEVNEPSPPTR